jgi:hypothetical protein
MSHQRTGIRTLEAQPEEFTSITRDTIQPMSRWWVCEDGEGEVSAAGMPASGREFMCAQGGLNYIPTSLEVE